MLVLKIVELLKREPSSDEVRWILYAGQDQDGNVLQLENDALEEQRQRWWVYQASDLCHIAFETILKFTLDTLGKYSGGLPLDRLIPICIERILEAAGKTPESWSNLLSETHLSANAYASDDECSEWSLCSAIMKRAGRRDETDCPPEIAWKAIQLLAALHKRVQVEDHPVERELGGRLEAEAFQTLLTETRFLDRQADLPLYDILCKLIEIKVIRRHLWIAARKFQSGDYTFLIESDEGRLRLREKDGPVFTNPRLGPAITFLRDVHLIGGQGLTDYGVEAVAAA